MLSWKIQFGYFLLAVLLFWCVQSQSLAHAEYEYPQPVYGVWIKYTVEKPVKQANSQKSRIGSNKTGLGYNPCSCVSYARWRTGINVGSIGVAAKHPVNSETPSVGAIIVLHSKPDGHLGAVESFTDTTVTFSDCNQDFKCKCGTRTYQLTDSRIVGYYK